MISYKFSKYIKLYLINHFMNFEYLRNYFKKVSLYFLIMVSFIFSIKIFSIISLILSFFFVIEEVRVFLNVLQESKDLTASNLRRNVCKNYNEFMTIS